MEFSDILYDFLTKNNLTQTAFASQIGVKQPQISEWLKGKAKPGYDNLRAICLAYGISPCYLLGLSDY